MLEVRSKDQALFVKSDTLAGSLKHEGVVTPTEDQQDHAAGRSSSGGDTR